MINFELKEKIADQVIDLLKEEVKQDFFETICGDWGQESIDNIYQKIIDITGDRQGTNILILYLFSTVCRNNRVDFNYHRSIPHPNTSGDYEKDDIKIEDREFHTTPGKHPAPEVYEELNYTVIEPREGYDFLQIMIPDK